MHNLGGGSDTSIPPIAYPVGTPFPAELLKDEKDYYIKTIMKQAESRTRKILESLKRQGFRERTGHKMHPFNVDQLQQIRDIITNPDSIEVAGHAPSEALIVGHISNACYVRGVPGATGGLQWKMFLCFRKRVDGNDVVYIHPEPVFSEGSLTWHLSRK